jgi:hypothetical protein
MKILYLTLAFLLEASAKPGYTDCDTTRDYLCDFDVKTGLRKQCIKRYVLDVSNPTATAYTNAKNADPDLVKGSETFHCHTQGADVDAVMLQHNIKDSETTVTSSYTKLDIPAGSAYSDELPKPTTLDEFV